MNDATLQEFDPAVTEELATGEAAGAWTQKGRPAKASDTDLRDWTETTARLRAVAEARGLTKSQVARHAEIPLGTLSPWYDGKYPGSLSAITARVKVWLDALEDRRRAAAIIPDAPGYVPTRTSRELTETLLYAQMMPEMVIVTLGAGMGKTTTARQYVEAQPGAFLVTMREMTRSVHMMVHEIALELGVPEQNPRKIDRAIGQKLKRNGRQTLLVIDEAQHLDDHAVNQLRYFLDMWGCGIALLGNEEIYARYGRETPKEGYGQIHRRIGKRMRRLTPLAEDIDALLDAWSIADRESRKLLGVIGRKPGALGQIDKTLRLAHMLAAGAGEALGPTHIRSAWVNRGGEELR